MELVNHPDHYNQGRIEVIDYIEDCIGAEGAYYFCIGNCLKYVSRAEYKGNQKQDIEKCRWYINKALELLDKFESKEFVEEFEEFPIQTTFNTDLKEE